MTCPSSFTQDNDKGKNGSEVSWVFSFTDNSLIENEPGITNNSFTVILTINDKNVSTALPKLLGIGENKVTYSVTDAVGKKADCTFKVEVKGKFFLNNLNFYLLYMTQYLTTLYVQINYNNYFFSIIMQHIKTSYNAIFLQFTRLKSITLFTAT